MTRTQRHDINASSDLNNGRFLNRIPVRLRVLCSGVSEMMGVAIALCGLSVAIMGVDVAMMGVYAPGFLAVILGGVAMLLGIVHAVSPDILDRTTAKEKQ